MKKNRTFEEQALHDVREAVKSHTSSSGLMLSHSCYPLCYSDGNIEVIRVDLKPELNRKFH